ncbi:MAG TPA: class I SAM-dependent methyltransferase [Gemmatimonadales bacterium]|nr:class I SAM-dependent methyltransferase [Gemmatimonadales bacterium]
MSDQKEIEFTYSLIDKIFRLSLGEGADYSCARYEGDFSLTLEQAQHRKHVFIAESLGVGAGARVLDMSCGWGPLLTHVRSLGAQGVGLTLSTAQAKACRRNGLEVHVMDCRNVDRDAFGGFDAVASVGGFEHFCSEAEYRAGRQEDIYRDLFRRVATLLPNRGRFYLQTMVFGRNMIPANQVSVHAPPDSDGFMLGLMSKQFPGSWLPYGKDQIEQTAEPLFRLVSASSGRLDYIETIKQWRKRFAAPSLKKFLLKLSLAPRYFTSADFRLAFTSGISSNTVCFQRELMDHFRLVFEKR